MKPDEKFDATQLLRQDLLSSAAQQMNLQATKMQSRPAATGNIADEVPVTCPAQFAGCSVAKARLRVCIAANLFARQNIQ